MRLSSNNKNRRMSIETSLISLQQQQSNSTELGNYSSSTKNIHTNNTNHNIQSLNKKNKLLTLFEKMSQTKPKKEDFKPMMSENVLKQQFTNIKLSASQIIEQKTKIIQHLKLQLQEAKYVISSLRAKNKQLLLKIKQMDKERASSNMNQQNIKAIQQQKQKMKEQLQWMKQNQKNDKTIIQTYEQINHKLTVTIHKLEQTIHQMKQQKLNLCNFATQKSVEFGYSTQKLPQTIETFNSCDNKFCNNSTEIHKPLSIQIQNSESQGHTNLVTPSQSSISNPFFCIGNLPAIQFQVQSKINSSLSTAFVKQNHFTTPKNKLFISETKRQNQYPQQVKNYFSKPKKENSPYKLKERVIDHRRNSFSYEINKQNLNVSSSTTQTLEMNHSCKNKNGKDININGKEEKNSFHQNLNTMKQNLKQIDISQLNNKMNGLEISENNLKRKLNRKIYI